MFIFVWDGGAPNENPLVSATWGMVAFQNWRPWPSAGVRKEQFWRFGPWRGGSLPSGKLIENNEDLKVLMLLCSLYIVLSKGVHEAFFGVGKHEFKMLKVSQKTHSCNLEICWKMIFLWSLIRSLFVNDGFIGFYWALGFWGFGASRLGSQPLWILEFGMIGL